MNEVVPVHEAQPLHELGRYLGRFELRDRMSQMALEITKLEVLHDDEYRIMALKPALRPDETMGILGK